LIVKPDNLTTDEAWVMSPNKMNAFEI